MATKNELLTTWCTWTGDPIPEARQRIRALFVENLLPDRANPLNYSDIARSIIGFVAPDMHKDAAETVKRLCEFRCTTVEGDCDERISTANLLKAMRIVFQPPYKLLSFSFSSTDSAELFVEKSFPNCDDYVHAKYLFKSPALEVSENRHRPITKTKTIYLDTIQHLLAIMTKERDDEADE